MNISSTLSRRDALRLFGFLGAGSLLATRSLGSDAATAPALSAAAASPQPGYYRFRIGDIEALALNDGGMTAPATECPWSAPGQTEALGTILDEAFLSTAQVNIPFGVLFARVGGERILVDTGCGALFGPVGGRLVGNLAAAGVRPEEITAVIITHLHGDHFGGLLNAEGKPIFPNAQLFIHTDEYAHWSGLSATGANAGSIAGAQKYLKAFEGKWQKVRGGEKLLGGLEVIDAPGHTPGHLMLQFHSGNHSLLHFVDVVHHHAISFTRPDFVNAFDVDAQKAIATRKAVLDRASADRVRVFGAHMPFPSLGHIRRKGGAFEYVIEPWAST